MGTCMRRSLYLLAAALVALSSKPLWAEQGARCIDVPPGTTPAAVTACEDAEHYTVTTGGSRHEFEKADFQAQLRDLITNWLDDEDLPYDDQAQLDVWLSVPDTSTQTPTWRVVAHLGSGRSVVVFLDFSPDSWRVSRANVGSLPDGLAYPRSFGDQAGALLLTPKAPAPYEQVRELLAEYGVLAPETPPSRPGVIRCWTPVLAERASAAAVQQDPRSRDLIDQLVPNSFLEWISFRQRVFAFSLLPS